MNPAFIALTVTLFIIGLFLFFFILKQLWKVVKFILKGITEKSTIFGDRLAIQLASLGLVALLFPRALGKWIVEPIRLLINLFTTFNYTLNNFWHQSVLSDTRSTEQIIEISVRFLSSLGVEFSRLINEFLYKISFTDLILIIGFWIILGQLVTVMVGALKAEESSGNSLRTGFGKLFAGKKTIHIIIIVLLLCFGTYLSFTAIIAIPWLNEKEIPEALNKDKLAEQLNAALLTEVEFTQRFPEDYSEGFNPFATLNQYLAENIADSLASSDSLATGEKIKAWLDYTRDRTGSENLQRLQLSEKWQEHRKKVYGKQVDMLKKAVNNFAVQTLAHMTITERTYYFQNTLAWYNENINKLINNLDRITEYLNARDLMWKNWADNTQASLEQAIDQLKKAKSREDLWAIAYAPSQLFDIGDSNYELILNERKLFQLPVDLEYLPNPPQPGSGWGTFGIMSRWLLKTRSFALVLITGMIGFGLVGSIIGLFIPTRKEESPERSILEAPNYKKVLRGFYAAIILFLTVQAGSEIFIKGEYQANPYTLFWFCLVGSAFGEVVWENALKQLIAKLSSSS